MSEQPVSDQPPHSRGGRPKLPGRGDYVLSLGVDDTKKAAIEARLEELGVSAAAYLHWLTDLDTGRDEVADQNLPKSRRNRAATRSATARNTSEVLLEAS